MKIIPTFMAFLAVLPFFATTVVAENDFARRLQAAAGSAGPDNLRSWVINEQLGDFEGRSLYPNRRWKDRNQDKVIIPYQIETRYFTSAEVQQIKRLTQELSDKVKVIQLVERTNQAAYIRIIRINDGCWSIVGKSSSGKSQDLNLAAWCFGNEGTIPHEFMHALGMTHEQNRPDRDNFVSINFNNIKPKARGNYEKATSSTTLGSPYDFGSVMHYGNRGGFALTNADIITTKPAGRSIGQRSGPSDLDIIKLRLMYQCRSGPRNYGDYQNNLCTSDCKCWEGATGCNGNDDACQGNLVCNNNVCSADGSSSNYCDSGILAGDVCCAGSCGSCGGSGCSQLPGGATMCCTGSITNSGRTCQDTNDVACLVPGGGGPSGGCTDIEGWVDAEGDGCDWYDQNNGCEEYGDAFGNLNTGKTANEACCVCGGGSLGGVTFYEFSNGEDSNKCLDLRASSTNNGNRIWLHECNGSPAQKWWVDSNYYIRSAVNTNKCIVGSAGNTDVGTNLIINDCFSNDNRFVIAYYTDDSFRPNNDESLCVGPSRTETVDGNFVVEFNTCSGGGGPTTSNHQKWFAFRSSRRFLAQDDRALQEECLDEPLGWYDTYGDNCDWYAEGDNCLYYGSLDVNFGKTANQACCACGGGSALDTPPDGSDDPPSLSDNDCFDFPIDWNDSVGDGCMWYAQGDNCQYYGNQFAGEFGTANEACCVCGGGTSQAPVDDPPATPGCSDSPSNWRDSDDETCGFYAQGTNCADYGNSYAGVDEKTANEACCICGGGFDPNGEETNTTPPPAPLPTPPPAPLPTPPPAPLPTPPPVPSPTPPPPNPSPPDDRSSDSCFSERSEVVVEGKGVTRMDALKIGDSVLSADGSFSKVYSFGHKASHFQTSYLQIFVASMSQGHPLEISSEHMIYTFDAAKDALKIVAAGDLKVGDSLLTKEGFPSKVLWIRKVERQGVYSPLTESGNLLVNGVLASNYVSRSWLKDYVSGDTLHAFQHSATLPVRLLCAAIDCKSETYNEITGFSGWVQFWFDVEQWMLSLPMFLQTPFLILLTVPSSLIMLLGKALVMPLHSWWLHALVATVGYFVWKCQYNKGSTKHGAENDGKMKVQLVGMEK